MAGSLKQNIYRLRYACLALSVCVLTLLSTLNLAAQVHATGLSTRNLELYSDAPSLTTTYTLSFTVSNSSTVGSLDIRFCSNSPLQDDTCVLPPGFDVTNAQLVAQSGITDFTLFVPATNDMVLSHTAAPVTAPLTVTLTFSNIVNPSSVGSFYGRISVYSSTDVSGTAVDFGGLALAIVNSLQINTYVPPYLIFCAAVSFATLDCSSANGDYINFGDLSPVHSSQADSQFLVATNAANGYIIQVYGPTMTSGNNIINPITSPTSSQPGTSQFGLNLRLNANPAIGADPNGPGNGTPATGYDNPDHFQFVSNDVIAGSLTTGDFRRFTVSYVVNTDTSQPAGIYVTTLTYVAVGSF